MDRKYNITCKSNGDSSSFPPSPATVRELYYTLSRSTWSRYTSNEKGEFMQDLLEIENHAAVLFTNIEFLKKFEKSKSIYIDDTFKSNSKKNQFHQMTILSTIFGQALPVIHIIMDSKSLNIYREIFKYIKTVTPTWNPEELSIVTSEDNNYLNMTIMEVFPRVKLYKSLFDHCKAILSNAKLSGIFEKISDSIEGQFLLKQYYALPLLPTPRVQGAITYLGETKNLMLRACFKELNDFFMKYRVKILDLGQIVRYEKIHYINYEQDQQFTLNDDSGTGIYRVIENLMTIDSEAQLEYSKIVENNLRRVKYSNRLSEYNMKVSTMSSKSAKELLQESSHLLNDIIHTLHNYNDLPIHPCLLNEDSNNESNMSVQPSTSQQNNSHTPDSDISPPPPSIHFPSTSTSIQMPSYPMNSLPYSSSCYYNSSNHNTYNNLPRLIPVPPQSESSSSSSSSSTTLQPSPAHSSSHSCLRPVLQCIRTPYSSSSIYAQSNCQVFPSMFPPSRYSVSLPPLGCQMGLHLRSRDNQQVLQPTVVLNLSESTSQDLPSIQNVQNRTKIRIHNWKAQREDEDFVEDKDDESIRCPICLEKRRRYALTCGHIFCGKCSMHIYNFDGKCPICRVDPGGEPIFLFMG